MLQHKSQLKSPTKAQVVEELERLGWEYSMKMFNTGTIYQMLPTDSRRKWYQFWKPNKTMLPTLFIGQYNISLVVEPSYNLTITLPLNEITLYRPNPYQLVVMNHNSDVLAVFGKNGWVGPQEIDKSLLC